MVGYQSPVFRVLIASYVSGLLFLGGLLLAATTACQNDGHKAIAACGNGIGPLAILILWVCTFIACPLLYGFLLKKMNLNNAWIIAIIALLIVSLMAFPIGHKIADQDLRGTPNETIDMEWELLASGLILIVLPAAAVTASRLSGNK